MFSPIIPVTMVFKAPPFLNTLKEIGVRISLHSSAVSSHVLLHGGCASHLSLQRGNNALQVDFCNKRKHLSVIRLPKNRFVA